MVVGHRQHLLIRSVFKFLNSHIFSLENKFCFLSHELYTVSCPCKLKSHANIATSSSLLPRNLRAKLDPGTDGLPGSFLLLHFLFEDLSKKETRFVIPTYPRHRKNAIAAPTKKWESGTYTAVHRSPGSRVIMKSLPRSLVRTQFFSLGNGGRLVFFFQKH